MAEKESKQRSKLRSDLRRQDPASNIFDRFLDAADRAGIKLRTADSVKWFIDRARVVGGRVTPEALMREARGKLVNKPYIGRMYMFYYDPKWKKELPYYDRFPLVIPIEYYDDGFLGLNLHYLPPKLRAALFTKLLEIASDRRYDERTKMQISYGMLKGASKWGAYKPCVKRYLTKHYRSRFIRIDADEWEIALALPVEQFEKASKSKVWSDSRSKMF